MTQPLERPTPALQAYRVTDQAHSLSRGWPWHSVPTLYRRTGRIEQELADQIAPAMNFVAVRLPILYLCGPVGAGKTSTAVKIASWAACGANRLFPRQGWMLPDAIQYQPSLRLGWLDEDAMAGLTAETCRILILDDLGGSLTAAALTKALELVETRSAWGRRTIITSTMTLEQLAAQEVKVFDREIGLASRINGGVVVELAGIDRRAEQDIIVPPVIDPPQSPPQMDRPAGIMRQIDPGSLF